MTVLSVYLPTPGSVLGNIIRPGSAIVGEPAGEYVSIDYEGNLYGANNLHEFDERLSCAAGRHVTGYPTVARRLAKPEELLEVGYYNYDARLLNPLNATCKAALEAWINEYRPS